MPEKLRTAVVLALRFLFLTRYSWLMAIALLGLPPFALVVAPPLLENLFVLDKPVQMLHVSWITMFCATTIITTLRITTLNAVDRFDDYRKASEDFQAAWGTSEPADKPWYRRAEVWWMLGLGLAASMGMWYGVVSACVAKTSADPGPAWGEFANEQTARIEVSAAAWEQALRGMAVTLGTLLLIYLALMLRDSWFSSLVLDDQSYRYTPGKRRSAIRPEIEITEQPIYEFLTYLFGPGYFRAMTIRRRGQEEEHIVLAPGHAGLILCTSLFFGWYGWNYWSVLRQGVLPDASSAFPALFFGLLSLLLLTLLLPGAAFLLDRHRIPIVPTLLIVMALLYGLFGTDHVYETNPDPRRAGSYAAMSWDEVLSQRTMHGVSGSRTLVVVDASGGGIQASAWTAQVLTGLHEIYGNAFSQSVGLISAVSGGSVGTMFYLVNRAEMAADYDASQGNVLPPASIQRIREASRASGLEATCWGIAYPDTLRAVFPPLAQETIDRGWSIEQCWRDRMKATDPRLADMRLSELGDRLQRGRLPIPVFNSTLVETGQRLLISPVLSPPPVGEQSSAGVEFLRSFPKSHMRISTAARLSATFPYVTPVVRPRFADAERALDSTDSLENTHVADGAYADNEGAVTSVDWINRLLVQYARPENVDARPFDSVLLIRIQALPKKSQAARAANSLAGWRAALLGPFDAMMQVRSASQTERGDLEINLLTRATLAELRAAKERAERDFLTLVEQVDQMEGIGDELRHLVESIQGQGSEVDSKLRELDDRLRSKRNQLDESQQRFRRLEELRVESVVFDFHPVDGVRIPLSWKLTSRQQRQIDRTWADLVSGTYPHEPLKIVDKYFQRTVPSNPMLRIATQK